MNMNLPGRRFSKANPLIWDHALPILLCLIYLVVVLYLGRPYSIGGYNNSDFYSRYAPDADRIAGGHFPEDTFGGPGYPVLLMAISGLTGDHFISGKWISAIAASLCGLVAFYLLRGLFGYWTAILALPIIFVSGRFSELSIDPGTDIPFLLLCLMVIFIFTRNQIGDWPKAALTGVIGGLAYLTRYNGVFLPATCLMGIVVLNSFEAPLLRRLKIAALHMLCFLATISPWLWLNYKHRGSPIYNTNYLNIATEFYGYKFNQDGITLAANTFHSFGDVLMYNPKHFLFHYVINIAKTFQKTLSGGLVFEPIGILAIAAIPFVTINRCRKDVALFLLSAVIYFLLMCLNHWESRYYFYLMVCYVGLACHLVVSGADWSIRKGVLSQRTAQVIVLCIGLLLFSMSAISAVTGIQRLIREQPFEIFRASEYLKSVSAKGDRIMARKPHLAYLSHREQVFFPTVKSINELHDALKKSPADYLIYDRVALEVRPELKMLAEPVNTISWLRPVYSDLPRSLVIYQVDMANIY